MPLKVLMNSRFSLIQQLKRCCLWRHVLQPLCLTEDSLCEDDLLLNLCSLSSPIYGHSRVFRMTAAIPDLPASCQPANWDATPAAISP